MNGYTDIYKRQLSAIKLTQFKKKSLSLYIFDLDSKKFAPRLADIENMANYLFKIHWEKYIDKLWIYRFVQ